MGVTSDVRTSLALHCVAPAYGIAGLFVLLLYAVESEIRFGKRAHSPHRHSRSQEHFRCVRISFDSFTRLVPHLKLKVFSPSLNDPDSRARFDGDFFRTCQMPPLLNDAPENIRGQKPVVFRRRDGAIWTDLCCFASCLGLRSVTARQNRNADSATSFAAPNC